MAPCRDNRLEEGLDRLAGLSARAYSHPLAGPCRGTSYEAQLGGYRSRPFSNLARREFQRVILTQTRQLSGSRLQH